MIPWTAPWFAPWRAAGERVEQAWRSGTPLHEALNTGCHESPVQFVAQRALPEGAAYEQFIFETGQCPVREGLHDFFNGLVWHAFPRTKSALNRLQAEAIGRDGIAGKRGAVRDAITVFDENGALLDAPGPLWEALLAREWHRLFVELRPLWAQARLLIFGHALLEQLAQPRKGLTAHVWAEGPSGFSGEPDAWLAGRTTAQRLQGKPFAPLPVLGVPGWWPGNADFCFYDDPLVFRPRRA
ncbi:MAG: DUF3025 domain-containing protein [Burkholderiales bacterium]|nr:DUF3025 domain-containing protein [Burkholderiales bacterium]